MSGCDLYIQQLILIGKLDQSALKYIIFLRQIKNILCVNVSKTLFKRKSVPRRVLIYIVIQSEQIMLESRCYTLSRVLTSPEILRRGNSSEPVFSYRNFLIKKTYFSRFAQICFPVKNIYFAWKTHWSVRILTQKHTILYEI